MKIDLELVPASHLLRDIVSTAEILAKQNHNELHLEQPMWEGILRVDPFRFRQCLLNLLSNSCKFTKNGRITIAVGEKSIEGKDWIQWSVRDTGIGISAAGCKKLFQTFSQVDESNTRKFGGTGLGLAISQQLCQAMGGHIAVESEPNVGSTFTINLPAYTAPEDETTQSADPEEQIQGFAGPETAEGVDPSGLRELAATSA